MILEAAVILTSLFSGHTCAAIDNRQNEAVFYGPNTPITRTAYEDTGEWIVYEDAPAPHDNAAWEALHGAEVAIQRPPLGPKVQVWCVQLS